MSESLHDEQLLTALFDGELQGDERARAEKLLADNLEYQQLFAQWKHAADQLRLLPQSRMDDGFVDRVLACITDSTNEAPVESPVVSSLSNSPWQLGFSAIATLAALLLLTLFVFPNIDQSPTLAKRDLGDLAIGKAAALADAFAGSPKSPSSSDLGYADDVNAEADGQSVAMLSKLNEPAIEQNQIAGVIADESGRSSKATNRGLRRDVASDPLKRFEDQSADSPKPVQQWGLGGGNDAILEDGLRVESESKLALGRQLHGDVDAPQQSLMNRSERDYALYRDQWYEGMPVDSELAGGMGGLGSDRSRAFAGKVETGPQVEMSETFASPQDVQLTVTEIPLQQVIVFDRDEDGDGDGAIRPPIMVVRDVLARNQIQVMDDTAILPSLEERRSEYRKRSKSSGNSSRLSKSKDVQLQELSSMANDWEALAVVSTIGQMNQAIADLSVQGSVSGYEVPPQSNLVPELDGPVLSAAPVSGFSYSNPSAVDPTLGSNQDRSNQDRQPAMVANARPLPRLNFENGTSPSVNFGISQPYAKPQFDTSNTPQEFQLRNEDSSGLKGDPAVPQEKRTEAEQLNRKRAAGEQERMLSESDVVRFLVLVRNASRTSQGSVGGSRTSETQSVSGAEESLDPDEPSSASQPPTTAEQR